jgi:hypothetical protein
LRARATAAAASCRVAWGTCGSGFAFLGL